MSAPAEIGIFQRFACIEVVQLASHAGLDFVVVDLEHSAIPDHTAWTILATGRALGISMVVRVADLNPGLINRYLEAGASGIQLTHVDSVEQLDAFDQAVRYPPAGRRSMSAFQPAGEFGALGVDGLVAKLEASPVLRVGQFENVTYSSPLADLVAKVDVVFIGRVDLRLDALAHGHTDDGGATIATIEAEAKRQGKRLGAFAADAAEAGVLRERGYDYLAVSSDAALLNASLLQVAGALR